MAPDPSALARQGPAACLLHSERTLVLIPAKDEAESLPAVLAELAPWHAASDTVVIDDGSEDSTAQIARKAGCAVLRHPINLGYGASLLTGYRFAVKRGYGRVVQMDADGQHPPAEIKKLLAPIQAGVADLVIGSRYLGEKSYRPGFFRRIASKIIALLASVWIRKRITDPTSGFQAMSRATLLQLCSDGFPEDYPDVDVLISLHRAGMRLSEIPVVMRARRRGKSMHGGIRVLYYFYRLGLCLLLLPVRRRSPYREQQRIEVSERAP